VTSLDRVSYVFRAPLQRDAACNFSLLVISFRSARVGQEARISHIFK